MTASARKQVMTAYQGENKGRMLCCKPTQLAAAGAGSGSLLTVSTAIMTASRIKPYTCSFRGVGTRFVWVGAHRKVRWHQRKGWQGKASPPDA
eukprot:1142473-Pelagomonas_calceolata.AAC.17